jgi:hypothetical protein
MAARKRDLIKAGAAGAFLTRAHRYDDTAVGIFGKALEFSAMGTPIQQELISFLDHSLEPCSLGCPKPI